MPELRSSVPARTKLGAALRVLGTLALLVGVPLVLSTFVGWPLPRDLPSTEELRRAWTQQDVPAATLAKGLALAVWVAWLQLTWVILTEAIAVVRGRDTRRVGVLPGIQHLGRQAVASVVLLVSSLSSTAASLPSAQPLAAVEVVGGEVAPQELALPAADVEQAAPSERTHTVVRGDSLWRLAEQYLGDGLRWSEIRDHNVGRTVAPGRVFTATDEHLDVGWTLVIPGVPAEGDAPGARSGGSGTAPAPAEGPQRQGVEATTTTAVPGDSLWELAEGHLADTLGRPPTEDESREYWAETVEVNRAQLADPENPDLIFVGQAVTLPARPGTPSTPGVQPPPGSSQPGNGTTQADGGDEIDSSRHAPRPRHDARPQPDPPPGPAEREPREVPPEATTSTTEATPPSASTGQQPIEQPGQHDPGQDAGAGGDRDESGNATDGQAAPVPGPPDGDGQSGTDERAQAEHSRPDPGAPSGTAPVASEANEAGEEQPRPDHAVQSEDEAEEDDIGGLGPVAIGLTGLAGTALAVGLVEAIRRLRRRRMYEAPETVQPVKQGSPVHRDLLIAADTDAVATLRRALASLSSVLADDDVACAPRIVQQGPDHLDVLIEPPTSPAIDGWEEEADGAIWACAPSTVAGAADEDAASPVPLLATLGASEDGTQLYVDLETVSVLSLVGDEAVASGVARAMVTELAYSPLADTTQVIVVGDLGVVSVARLDHVTVVPDWPSALPDVESWAKGSREALSLNGWPNPFVARGHSEYEDALAPLLVVADHAPEPDTLAVLGEGPSAAAVVVVTDQPLPDSMVVVCGEDELMLPQLGLACPPQTLSRDDLDAVVDILADAGGWDDADLASLLGEPHEVDLPAGMPAVQGGAPTGWPSARVPTERLDTVGSNGERRADGDVEPQAAPEETLDPEPYDDELTDTEAFGPAMWPEDVVDGRSRDENGTSGDAGSGPADIDDEEASEGAPVDPDLTAADPDQGSRVGKPETARPEDERGLHAGPAGQVGPSEQPNLFGEVVPPTRATGAEVGNGHDDAEERIAQDNLAGELGSFTADQVRPDDDQATGPNGNDENKGENGDDNGTTTLNAGVDTNDRGGDGLADEFRGTTVGATSDAEPATGTGGFVTPPTSEPRSNGRAHAEDRADAATEPAIVVRFLGEITVEGARKPLTGKQTAAVAYIAVQGTVSADRLDESVWQRPAGGQRHRRLINTMSECRAALGGQHLPPATDAKYKLGPRVVTDLQLFERHVDSARGKDPAGTIDALSRAFALVRGRVFTYSTSDSHFFRWVDLENWISRWEIKVAAVAQDLAAHHLDLGNPPAAVQVAEQALRFIPTHAGCTETLMRAYAASGDLTAVHQTYESHLSTLDHLDLSPVAESTATLYAHLRGWHGIRS